MLGLSPAESSGIRETLSMIIVNKPERYGFSHPAHDRIEALKDPWAFLPFFLLQAMADKCLCTIVIHGLGEQEVHVRHMEVVPESEIHKECLGGIL